MNSLIIVYTQSESQVVGAVQLLNTIIKNDEASLYVYDTSKKFARYFQGNYVPIVKKNVFKVILYSIILKCILILGDDRKLHIFFQILFHISRKNYFVDDGLLSFWLFEKYHIQKKSKNIFIFTKYKNYIEQYFGVKSKNLFKQDLLKACNQKPQGDIVLIIGGAYLSIGYISKPKYIALINNIAIQFPNKLVYFLPHPRDLNEFLELENAFFEEINLIKSNESFEKKISKYLKPDADVVSFFSSALLDCKLIQNHANYYYVKLPGYLERENARLQGIDPHMFGFNVEKRIYDLYNEIGFKELKIYVD